MTDLKRDNIGLSEEFNIIYIYIKLLCGYIINCFNAVAR
jgi:hypothetical protein